MGSTMQVARWNGLVALACFRRQKTSKRSKDRLHSAAGSHSCRLFQVLPHPIGIAERLRSSSVCITRRIDEIWFVRSLKALQC